MSRTEHLRLGEIWAETSANFIFLTAFQESEVITVIKKNLIRRLENPDRSQWPNWRDLMLGSVQLWVGKERQYALPELRGLPGVFRWNLEYDSFLGYMAGVLPFLKADQNGFEPL